MVLIGATINCAIHPHVQGWLLIANHVGMSFMRVTWKHCPWSDHETAIVRGEVGLSRAILAAGFGIASRQYPYQTEFRLPCQIVGDPAASDLDIYNQIFVKFGGDPLRRGWLNANVIQKVNNFPSRK